MNSEISPSSSLPALPVRRRETLEIFDTALKLFRRYVWILLGWSALTTVPSLVPYLGSMVYIFVAPVTYGAVSCCIAAAVRGQKVTFGQCWTFTKPRYWDLVGVIFLSILLFFGLILGIYIAGALLFVLGALILSKAPEPVQIVATIIGVAAMVVLLSILALAAFGWMNMVPIVACLEDDKRGSAAMGRAYELLKGNWRRVFGMSLILGLAALAFFGVVGGIMALIGAGTGLFKEIFSPTSESSLIALILGMSSFLGLFAVVWNPAQYLVIAVLYLDLRVRREALDLEWTAYASAPAPNPNPAVADGTLRDNPLGAVENSLNAVPAMAPGSANPSTFGGSPTGLAPQEPEYRRLTHLEDVAEEAGRD